MKIVISPAKKMIRPEGLGARTVPVFNERAVKTAKWLSGLGFEEMKRIMKASDRIIDETMEMYRAFMAGGEVYPALLSYDGIQYRYMAQDVFTEDEYAYLDSHLRILSGLYGILRPFDGIKPYRLEMQAKFGKTDLYSLWGDLIYRELTADDDVILNLASEEYGKCIRRNLEPGIRLVDTAFYQRKNGKLMEQATYAKMLRGRSVRFLAEHSIEDPEDLKELSEFGYSWSEEESTEDRLVFVKEM